MERPASHAFSVVTPPTYVEGRPHSSLATTPSIGKLSMKSRHGPKKPYKELTLVEKVQLIELAERNPGLSQASIAERYEIAKSNVCRILQRRDEYVTAFRSDAYAAHRKRKLKMTTGGGRSEVEEVGPTAAKRLHMMLVANGNEALRAHMYKTHQIARMFTCRCCNHAFIDKPTHDAHIESVHGGHAGNDEHGDSTTVDDNNNSVGDMAPPPMQFMANQHAPTVALLAQLTAARQQRQHVPLCPPVTSSAPPSMLPIMLHAMQQNGLPSTPTPNLTDILLKLRERNALAIGQHAPPTTPQFNAALAAILSANNNHAVFPKLDTTAGAPNSTPLNLMATAAAAMNAAPEQPHHHMMLASDGDDELHSSQSTSTTGDPDGHRAKITTTTPSTPEASSTTHLVVKVKAESEDGGELVVDVEGEQHDMNNNDGDVKDANVAKESNMNSLISALAMPLKTNADAPPTLHTSSPDSSTAMTTLLQTMMASKDSSVSPPTTTTSHSSSSCHTCQTLRTCVQQHTARAKFMEANTANIHSEMSRVKSANQTLTATNEQLKRCLIACQQRSMHFLQSHAQPMDTPTALRFVQEILQSTLHA